MKNPNSIPHMHFSPSHQCLEELFSIMIRVWLRNAIFYWLKMLQWIVRRKYKERSANMCAFFLSLAHWSTSQVFSIRWKYISFSLHVGNRREWKLQKKTKALSQHTHSLSLSFNLIFSLAYFTPLKNSIATCFICFWILCQRKFCSKTFSFLVLLILYMWECGKTSE